VSRPVLQTSILAPHRASIWTLLIISKSCSKPKKDDAVPIAIRDAFSVARSRFEQSQEAAHAYTMRAKHRAIIQHARSRYQQTKDAAAYEREVAAYTDPADFAPYTEDWLETYTVKMENLTADFDNLTATFTALSFATQNSNDEFYVTAHACFSLYCECYKMVVDAYRLGALLANLDAAVAKERALQDSVKAWIKYVGENPDSERRTTEAEIKAELFQEKAKVAETKAEAFLAKVKEVLEE